MEKDEREETKAIFRRIFRQEYRLEILEIRPCNRQLIGYTWFSTAGTYKWRLRDMNGREIKTSESFFGKRTTLENAQSYVRQIGGKIVKG